MDATTGSQMQRRKRFSEQLKIENIIKLKSTTFNVNNKSITTICLICLKFIKQHKSVILHRHVLFDITLSSARHYYVSEVFFVAFLVL